VPTRFHLTEGDRDWTAEVSGREVTLSGEAGAVEIREDERGALHIDAPPPVVGVAAASGDVVWVSIDGDVFEVRVSQGARSRPSSRDQDAFTPPMAATVVRVLVKPGDAVHNGDTLVALEAMKMELPIRAPRDGIVRAVNCRPGDLVQPGVVLVELE
jgi:3-methylcrotonyl-CoA carboxylase alpha subunit